MFKTHAWALLPAVLSICVIQTIAGVMPEHPGPLNLAWKHWKIYLQAPEKFATGRPLQEDHSLKQNSFHWIPPAYRKGGASLSLPLGEAGGIQWKLFWFSDLSSCSSLPVAVISGTPTIKIRWMWKPIGKLKHPESGAHPRPCPPPPTPEPHPRNRKKDLLFWKRSFKKKEELFLRKELFV